MGKVLVTDTHLTDIANAIRDHNGETTTYKPGEMATAINNISASEDLTTELTEYDAGLTTQEATIDDIIEALQNKGVGSGLKPIGDKNIGEAFYDAYSNYHDMLSSSYNKKYDTNDQVFLYTPDAACTKYYILYYTGYNYSSVGYIIVWRLPGLVGQYNDTTVRWYEKIGIQTQFVDYDATTDTKSAKKAPNAFLGPISIDYGARYDSPLYATLEEAIAALKDSSTTYTKFSTANMYTMSYLSKYGDTQTSVVATNSIEIGLTGLVNECGRQISSNESIVAITTE